MSKHDYNKISLSPIPRDIIDKYNSMDKQIVRFIYFIVEKIIYGLVQSSIISHTEIK